MSNDRYYDEILAYITENGETGVNALAKLLNVPLTTMQRYLEKQTYFRKTVNRKWDLPDNVNADIKTNTMTLIVESVENTLKLITSQLEELQTIVQVTHTPLNSLKRAVSTINAPVAGNGTKIRPRLVEINEGMDNVEKAIKGHIKNVPEMYQDLLLNLDVCRLITEMGTLYMKGDFNTELMNVLTAQADTLSEDALELLKEYQIGTNEDE